MESDCTAMNDAELVEQILNGNNNAFRYLVANYQRLVLHVVGRIVRRQDEVEDICQEVFIKVFRKMKRFRGESRLSTWIATIAYNTSISHVRKLARRGEQLYEDNPAVIALERDESLNQKVVEKEEAKKILMEMIEQLPVNYRTVLTLFHLEEFSYKEIEEITGMPEGTIKSYLSRARKLLKGKLEKVVESEKTNFLLIMRENEKYFDAEKIVDEALKSEPNFSLPDNFAEMVAEKVGRKFAWQQYVMEFLIYLGAFVGIAIISAAIALIWYDTNWTEWLNFILTNVGLVVGINFLAVFILFADRVLLRYFMFKAEEVV